MTEEIRSYLLSVTAAALIWSLISLWMGKETAASGVIRLICGVFLATVILRPGLRLRLDQWQVYEAQFSALGQTYAEAGQQMAETAIMEGLAEKTEQRILREAEKLGSQLQAEIFWEGYQPRQIILRGAISPYGKAKLSRWIEENIGISEAGQIWIG